MYFKVEINNYVLLKHLTYFVDIYYCYNWLDEISTAGTRYVVDLIVGQ